MTRLKKILPIITFIKRNTVDNTSGIDNHVEFHETATKRISTYEKPWRLNAYPSRRNINKACETAFIL